MFWRPLIEHWLEFYRNKPTTEKSLVKRALACDDIRNVVASLYAIAARLENARESLIFTGSRFAWISVHTIFAGIRYPGVEVSNARRNWLSDNDRICRCAGKPRRIASQKSIAKALVS